MTCVPCAAGEVSSPHFSGGSPLLVSLDQEKGLTFMGKRVPIESWMSLVLISGIIRTNRETGLPKILRATGATQRPCTPRRPAPCQPAGRPGL